MSSDGESVEGWNSDSRVDGMQVVVIGNTIVATHPTRPSIVACPCCGKPFFTKRGAKLVANALYRLEPRLN